MVVLMAKQKILMTNLLGKRVVCHIESDHGNTLEERVAYAKEWGDRCRASTTPTSLLEKVAGLEFEIVAVYRSQVAVGHVSQQAMSFTLQDEDGNLYDPIPAMWCAVL